MREGSNKRKAGIGIRLSRIISYCALWATGISFPTLSFAASDRVLEEVVVTAQRRAESAQDTPISLAAFSSERLDVLGISNIADLQAQVPNFLLDTFPSSNQTLRLYIRGIGVNDVQITQDPAVGVYLDGVYLARATGLASEIADLERIEVLRGPQGTLYGRNTTGGALNLITARPDLEAVGFRQDLGAGNRDHLFIRSQVNIPVAEGHAVKAAALLSRRDGFVDNLGPGGDFGDRDASAYRIDWRWQPTDGVTVDYAWDKSTIESHNYTPQAITPGVETGSPVDAAVRSSRRFVPYGRERFDELATSVALQPNDTEIEGHSLHLDVSLEAVTIRSITAWRELEDLSYIDFASGASEEYRVDFGASTLGSEGEQPLLFESTRTRVEQNQFSQELQLLGSLGANVDYVTGLYYFRERATEDWFPLHHIFSFPLIELNDRGYAVNIRAEDNDIENEAFAFFAQAGWRPEVFSGRLQVSAGWRHSEDRREVRRRFEEDNYIDLGQAVLGPLASTRFRSQGERDFDDDSFSMTVEYDWTANFLPYAKYVEAYKSGGFNTRDPDPEFFAEGFDAEKNRTAEVGFKGELLGNTLRVNGALFYSRFDDLQLNFQLPGTISDTRVFNSGEASLNGVELEIVSSPLPGFQCALTYAYLDSDIDPVADPFTGEERNFSFTNAPRHTGTLSFDYQKPMGHLGTLIGNLNYNYVAEREGANPRLARESYDLLNGRVGMTNIPLPAGALSVSAWVKNALDDDYVAFAIDNLPHASRAVLWGETRTWGIDLRYDY